MNEQTIALFGSKNTDHWQTPPEILEYIEKHYGKIGLDPCPRHPKEDGLLMDWKCEDLVFVNPPYSQCIKWFAKAHEELKKGNCKNIVFLVFANTDTQWFHTYIQSAYRNYLSYNEERTVNESYRQLYAGSIFADIEFIKGRLKFISDNGVRNSAMRPSILVKLWR